MNRAFIVALAIAQCVFVSTKFVYAEDAAPKITATADSCKEALTEGGSTAAEEFRGIKVFFDTNVIMDDPHAAMRFPGADIVVHGTVLRELNDNKNNPDVRRPVRAFSRALLQRIVEHQKMGESKLTVPIKGTSSTMTVDAMDYTDLLKGTAYAPELNDNKIIAAALAYKNQLGADKVLFVTNDVLAAITAFSLGIRTQEFFAGMEQSASGSTEVVDAESLGQLEKVELTDEQMEKFVKQGTVPWPEGKGLRPNQFVRLFSPSRRASAATVARYIFARPKTILKTTAEEFEGAGPHDSRGQNTFALPTDINFSHETLRVSVNGTEIPNVADNKEDTGGWYYDGANHSVVLIGEDFEPDHGAYVEVKAQIEKHRIERLKTFDEMGLYGIQHRSLEQKMVLNVELDPDIDIVIQEGRAGTSKTFNGVLAAMKHREENKKNRVFLTRALVQTGAEKMGELPGNADDKQFEYFKPIIDNFLAIEALKEANGKSSSGGNKRRPYGQLPEGFSMEAFNFLRGRSISNAVVLLEEGQNTRPKDMKMFLTRIGENVKIMITGDTGQVDPPYLNPNYNGLTTAIDRFLRDPKMTPERLSRVAIIKLRTGIRSDFTEMTSDIFESVH